MKVKDLLNELNEKLGNLPEDTTLNYINLTKGGYLYINYYKRRMTDEEARDKQWDAIMEGEVIPDIVAACTLEEHLIKVTPKIERIL